MRCLQKVSSALICVFVLLPGLMCCSANCTGETAQSYDGINVTDAMLFGPIRYYKCHRLKQENGSMQIREVWLASLLIGTVLVAVVLGH